MEQPSPKIRMVAIVATVIALLAVSVPFMLQGRGSENPSATVPPSDAQSASPGPGVAPVASHDAPDAVPAGAPPSDPSGACMADAKPANFDFTMKDLDGKDVSLASFKGKVVLLNFWATWCGPCKAEIPAFVELQEKYRNDGLVVVGYSVDDEAPKARTFADEYKMNYPVLLGLGREDVQEAYGPIWGIPASFIISRSGTVCQKHLGIAEKEVFEREIKALL